MQENGNRYKIIQELTYMTKISIRFYNDHEVRAIWDEEKSKWWFSAVDIVAAITDTTAENLLTIKEES